jgi:DNA polymerase III epsilon subunit-like protein
MISGDLLRYNLENKKFVTFDYEGDLNLFYSTPFQLGFTISEGNKIIKEYDFYIKWPDIFISNFVKKYAHYDPERMRQNGVSPLEVFSIFEKYINNPDYHYIGANILAFDTILTYNCFKKLGLKHNYDFLNRVYDVNALFKLYKLGIKPNNEDLLAQQYSINDYKLKGLKSNVAYVAKEFGIEFDENRMHDALTDVKVIASNFFELIKRIDIK